MTLWIWDASFVRSWLRGVEGALEKADSWRADAPWLHSGASDAERPLVQGDFSFLSPLRELAKGWQPKENKAAPTVTRWGCSACKFELDLKR